MPVLRLVDVTMWSDDVFGLIGLALHFRLSCALMWLYNNLDREFHEILISLIQIYTEMS